MPKKDGAQAPDAETTIKLGGREREFRYSHAERDMLEERFGKGLLELIREDVLPTNDKGVPTAGGRWRSQVGLIAEGLKHYGKSVTERRVEEWLKTHLDHGGNAFEVINAAVMAVFASGILGFVVDRPEEEDAADPGKG